MVIQNVSRLFMQYTYNRYNTINVQLETQQFRLQWRTERKDRFHQAAVRNRGRQSEAHSSQGQIAESAAIRSNELERDEKKASRVTFDVRQLKSVERATLLALLASSKGGRVHRHIIKRLKELTPLNSSLIISRDNRARII